MGTRVLESGRKRLECEWSVQSSKRARLKKRSAGQGVDRKWNITKRETMRDRLWKNKRMNPITELPEVDTDRVESWDNLWFSQRPELSESEMPAEEREMYAGLIHKFGLDFSAAARSHRGQDYHRILGELQRYYYSRPTSRFEIENATKSSADPDLLHEEGADWYLDDTWQSTETSFNKIHATFAGRSWDFLSFPDLVRSIQPVLCPCVACPDAPQNIVFPIQLNSIRIDHADDAILVFRWFYAKKDLPKVPHDFEDNELALGTAIFETPADYIRDSVLVSFSDFCLDGTSHRCSRIFDDANKTKATTLRKKKHPLLRRLFPKLVVSLAPTSSSTTLKFLVSSTSTTRRQQQPTLSKQNISFTRPPPRRSPRTSFLLSQDETPNQLGTDSTSSSDQDEDDDDDDEKFHHNHSSSSSSS